jgi:hypothetical protein
VYDTREARHTPPNSRKNGEVICAAGAGGRFSQSPNPKPPTPPISQTQTTKPKKHPEKNPQKISHPFSKKPKNKKKCNNKKNARDQIPKHPI